MSLHHAKPFETEICEYLDSEAAKYDSLATEAQRAMDLLQERRTALISAAVTGQIDVRPPAERAGQLAKKTAA